MLISGLSGGPNCCRSNEYLQKQENSCFREKALNAAVLGHYQMRSEKIPAIVMTVRFRKREMYRGLSPSTKDKYYFQITKFISPCLMAIVDAAFNTPTEPYANPTLPPTSSPNVAANRLLMVGKILVYFPSVDTSPKRFKRLSLGTRTLWNLRAPLSTPFNPTLYPQSRISIPGSGEWSSRDRIGTINAWTPISLSRWESGEGKQSRAKTAANFPWTAAFPIHHLVAPSLGVFMTNDSDMQS